MILQITGIMVYYYFICPRKLWYFTNEINMEQNSELVSIGKILDETSYTREKKGILIDNTINIDFIKNGAVLHEVKKTKSIEEAGIWQLKYYMYYLQKKRSKSNRSKNRFSIIKRDKAGKSTRGRYKNNRKCNKKYRRNHNARETTSNNQRKNLQKMCLL